MPYKYSSRRKVEFADTDMAGIVHFSRFFVFAEIIEHEFLRSLTRTTIFVETDGGTLRWPRLEASCRYVTPARFEDELDITLWIVRKGTKSLTYRFGVRRAHEDIAVGQISIACCVDDPERGFRAIPIPGFIAEQIQETPASGLSNDRSGTPEAAE